MTHRVDTIEQLLALYPGAVVEAAWRKETPRINDDYRQLIEAAPFFALASIGADDGAMDCSPRGDGPGFVKILDERTIAFPDRRGNNRLDSLRNIVIDPRVALLFLIPGWNECLRINGRAHLTTEPELLSGFSVNGNSPATVIVVRIETMYFQCARAIKRAGLWSEDVQMDPNTLPSAGKLVKSVIEEFDAEGYDSGLQERQAKTLY